MSRLPPNYEPIRLFNTPQDVPVQGAGTGTPKAPFVPPSRGRQPSPGQPHQPTQQRLQEPAHRLPPVQTPSHRFLTPAGHFTNPLDNLVAAATNLAALPIMGNSPVEIEAWNSIEMLKTAVAQQAYYSYS